MSTYTIGEISNHSGFSASALRYYEGIGLVEPAGRTDSGYRLYDEGALTRLAFIARAKQLGCSLEEITDLIAIWDGQRCGPVQRRLHELVTDKIREAQHQATALAAFSSQLQRAAEHLNADPADGPCDEDCACVAASDASASATGPAARSTAPPPGVAIACSLDAGALSERLVDWHAVLAQAQSRLAIDDGGVRVEFGDDVDLGELAVLVAAEQRCCPFFAFALTVDHRGRALEVRAPDDAAGIVTELFGQPA